MTSKATKQASVICLALALGFVPPSTKTSNSLNQTLATEWLGEFFQEKGTIVSLKDFTKEEVRSAGITLAKDMKVHIAAVGGGDRGFWSEWNDDEDPQLYAAGWIINAETRAVVWEMTLDNTSGHSERRTFDSDLTLPKGSYEVYFSAHGYYKGSRNSHYSTNIDRRDERKGPSRLLGKFMRIFSNDRDNDLYDEFMDLAKEWNITLTVPQEDAASVQRFQAPLQTKQEIFSATKLGDLALVKKGLSVTKETPVRIYALGEGRKHDDVYDYGWIVNSDTRERIWEMTLRNTRYAGGSSKNIKFDDVVKLPKGNYELYYITDDSHSNEDWNAKPSFDPYNYGMTLFPVNETDRGAVKITGLPDMEKNVVVKLNRIGDNDMRSAGFSLKTDMKLHIYAIGEGPQDRSEMADYGWIVNAKTREKVWKMEPRRTYHAGGDSKNRMVDQIVSLPKGNYIAYYATDGSHSYDEWNADPPFDPEHWGLLITGAGEQFSTSNVSEYSAEKEEGLVAQIIRVRDDRRERKTFTLEKPTTVRVYAIGEGQDREMYDYGWIENAKTGRVVWEMTYGMTSNAGGARKNRMVETTISLEKGEYELHYETDGSHSFNDWNDDPPEDREHWGITLYRDR